jgi:hypothetical protein
VKPTSSSSWSTPSAQTGSRKRSPRVLGSAGERQWQSSADRATRHHGRYPHVVPRQQRFAKHSGLPRGPHAHRRSGTGAKTDRHPVRSGQRVDGRNRNENPVAGRGTRAGRVAHNLPTSVEAPNDWRLSTMNADLAIGTRGRSTGNRARTTLAVTGRAAYRIPRCVNLACRVRHVWIDTPGRCRTATPVPRRPCGESCIRPDTFRVRASLATPAGFARPLPDVLAESPV